MDMLRYEIETQQPNFLNSCCCTPDAKQLFLLPRHCRSHQIHTACCSKARFLHHQLSKDISPSSSSKLAASI